MKIEKGRASGIISWHPDRLARNSVDGGKIIYLLDTGKLSALKFNTFWFEPTPQGKFMLSISFSQSKYYVDSLSENTRRGLRQKARNGNFPCKAPLGYINDSRNKTIVVNKRIAPVITQAFEMYSMGDKSIKDITSFLQTQKVLNPQGNRIDEDKVRYILKKTFYYGVFTYGGDVYEGRHEPIISKKLFDEVQEVLNRRNRQWKEAKVNKIIKPYLGLIRCGECGMMISAEVQDKYYKGTNRNVRYTYYHCTKKNKYIKCSQKYLRDIYFEPQLTTLIKKYTLKKTWANQMLLKLKQEESDISKSCLEVIHDKRKDLETINLKLKLLLDSYLDQVIDVESFQEKKLELVSKKKTIEEQILSLKRSQGNWLEPMKNWIAEASEVDQIISTNNKEQIKVLASKIFGSNLQLQNKKLQGDGLNAWSALRADPPSRKMVPKERLELS